MLKNILKLLVLLVVLTLSSATMLLAEECDAACPVGQVLVSFSDGNSVTCVCLPKAEMVEE